MSTAVLTTPALSDLVALTKPRITFMVLVTTAGGLWLAPTTLEPAALLLVLLATAMVVGAANALNCWLERDVDRHMSRTRERPLPAGRLEARHALWLGLGLGAVSVPTLALVANPLTGLLAALALVSYVWVYTPMKQLSPKALLVGAVPGALPPLMGWTAATGELAAPGLVLFGILFLWQLPHFLAIALFREAEYGRAGIKVLPVVRGRAVTARHAAFYAALLLPVSLLLTPLGIAGWVYFTVATAGGLVYLGWALVGLTNDVGDRWAKRLFLISLVYLPVVFAALGLDVVRGS